MTSDVPADSSPDLTPQTHQEQPGDRVTDAGLGARLEEHDGRVPGDTRIPSEAEFEAQVRDGRAGDSVADQPSAPHVRHEEARDAVAWDETTNS